MEYIDWFPERVSQLRIQKGVSARDMSLSLGQSESYINKIENRRALPSMTGFIAICEYFGITPKDFFETGVISPAGTTELVEAIGRLKPSHIDHLLQIIRDITGEQK